MFSTAVAQSSPAFFTFLYSTRKDWMGKPRLPRGIQVTYADVSVAVETVGLSGASGAAEEGERERSASEDGGEEEKLANKTVIMTVGVKIKKKEEKKKKKKHIAFRTYSEFILQRRRRKRLRNVSPKSG